MAEHTKAQWEAWKSPDGWVARAIFINDEGLRCIYFPATFHGAGDGWAETDAIRTCRAVNCHDDLVAALTEAKACLYSMVGQDGRAAVIIDRIDAALAKANR